MGPDPERPIPGQVGHVLKDVFGFHSFLPNQEEIVRAILARRDAFVVMPTGGGKSLCYQLPAHIMPGACMVISPLISLMKDQVDAARATGLRAAFLNSSQTGAARRAVEDQLLAGGLDLVYVSPERFAMPAFVALLRRSRLGFVAVDEAHCISEWGHDFRPDYLTLSTIVREFPDVPVAAFTATATHRVQEDIVTKLGLRSPHIVRASFNRPNLFYKVVPKERLGDQVLRFVQAHAGEPGIIYRTTRKSVEQTADLLVRNGIKALPYHAGLAAAARVANQDAFNRDEVDVIVATIAFGMGIDKSNVRYVLHADLPKNIESYYQETGRAGRDGEPAHCLLLFGYGDIPKIRFFIDQPSPGPPENGEDHGLRSQTEDEAEAQRRHAIKALNDMVRYATTCACRRKQLLAYFGEIYPSDGSGDAPPDPDGTAAGCCDVCAGEVERVDATRDAQIVLSAIARTGERFGVNHVLDVVVGADTQRLRELQHDRIKTYGAGKGHDRRHWRSIIDNLLAQGLVLQTGGQYPVLRLEPEAREVLFGGVPVFMLRRAETAKKRRRAEAGPHDADLFALLRDLRKRLASEQNVPPYVVFSDRTLHEMAREFPVTESEMAGITGVGERKLARYGAIFAETVSAYIEAHPGLRKSAPAAPVAPVPPAAGKGRARSRAGRGKPATAEKTWELLRQGLSPAEIARERGLTEGTVVTHLERLILAGKEIDIDSLVAPHKRLLLEEIISGVKSGLLAEVMAVAGETISYEEARLVRAWLQRRQDADDVR